MNRHVLSLALGVAACLAGAAQAAVYDDIFWVGGDGEWTGDVTANPEYSTGNWSTDPNATTGMPAKFVFGRNDGIRVNQVVGAGNTDMDRVPCFTGTPCTGTVPGGTQLGTDIFINKPVTVFYNPNRQTLSSVGFQDRFGDWRIQPDPAFPGTPTFNLSNGAIFDHTTTLGGDEDGMWTRWNGAALNIDNATFRRRGDEVNGFSGGAFMFASFHGFPDSVQTVSITNGGRFENEGQVWFGQSEDHFQDLGNQPGISVVVTINDGHMDLTGGDEYGLDNDGLPLRADLAFIYQHSGEDKEEYVINFTGPGTITVDGDDDSPLDGDMTTGGGGIRIATMMDSGVVDSGATGGHLGHTFSDYGTDATTQRSYQDLWDLGILRAHNQSGLTGANFNEFFTVMNTPGQTDYKLTSNVVPIPAVAGDYNGNGTVDAADYVLWRSGAALQNEVATVGMNTAEDYAEWRARFGNTAPGSGGALGTVAVPEPGTMLLVTLGLGSLMAFKRREN